MVKLLIDVTIATLTVSIIIPFLFIYVLLVGGARDILWGRRRRS